MSPMVRRSIAVGLALLFLLVGGSPVSAFELRSSSATAIAVPVPWEPTPHPGPFLSQDEALAIFQQHAQLNLEEARLEAYLERWNRNPTWNFSYVTSRGPTWHSSHIGSIHAQTGQLISLNLAIPQLIPLRTGPLQTPYPEEFARIWARAKVREVMPQEFANLREAPAGLQMPANLMLPNSNNTYSYTWLRYIGDLPVLDNFVTVALDKETLRCVYFLANLYDWAVSPMEPAISSAEALEIFQEYGLELTYVGVFTELFGHSDAFRPVWRARSTAMVDPLTGELLDERGMPIPRVAASIPIPANDAIAVRPGPLPLTPDHALAFAAQVLETPPGAHLQISSWQGPEAGYSIYWDEGPIYGSLRLDRDTGLIKHAYRGIYTYQEAEAAPTEEQISAARLTAIETVQRLYHGQIHNLRMGNAQAYSPYEFFFQRYENGIPVEYEGVYVSVDPYSLQWTNLSATWTTSTTFSAPNPSITKAEAERIYFANRTAMLVYTAPFIYLFRYGEPTDFEAMAPTYVLSALHVGGVDGTTGQLLDQLLRPLNWADQIKATISGHWAEHELWFAFGRGALSPSKPSPSASLTRFDAIRLLLTEFDYWNYPSDLQEMPYVDVPMGSVDASLVEIALHNGWIVPQGPNPRFNGEQPISRAEFAMMVARYLQLGDLAASKLQTQTNYTDLSRLQPEQRNAIAFLEALGIVRSATTFRPDDALTQAEAAVILVRLLNRAWGW